MPLSDHEQRMLAEIERALYAEDPKFAATVGTTTLQAHYQRRIALAVGLFLVGVVGLLSGVIVGLPLGMWLGLAGFTLMLTGVLLVLTNVKRLRNGEAPKRRGGARAAGPERPAAGGDTGEGGGFRRRMNDRWERRWEERGGDTEER